MFEFSSTIVLAHTSNMLKGSRMIGSSTIVPSTIVLELRNRYVFADDPPKIGPKPVSDQVVLGGQIGSPGRINVVWGQKYLVLAQKKFAAPTPLYRPSI